MKLIYVLSGKEENKNYVKKFVEIIAVLDLKRMQKHLLVKKLNR